MDPVWQNPAVIEQTQTILRSLKHFTGRNLVPSDHSAETVAKEVYQAPFVLVSHGTGADPILNYGNATAQTLWEMPWEELTRTPSRYTAETPERKERSRLLSAVMENGFIDNYSGTRISKSGRRFRIARATVWNLVTPEGKPAGQAACFSQWEFL